MREVNEHISTSVWSIAMILHAICTLVVHTDIMVAEVVLLSVSNEIIS